jgi:hypothetical protein
MLLDIETRPTVMFNPELESHRAHFAKFRATGSWRDCPVRFAVRDWPSNNLAAAIQSLITDFYLQKEFAHCASQALETPEPHGNQV